MEVKLDKIEINWDKSLSLKIQTYALDSNRCYSPQKEQEEFLSIEKVQNEDFVKFKMDLNN